MNLQFTSIEKHANGTWLFAWELTGAPYYRVVLFGKELVKIPGGSFLYNLAIPAYPNYPPPIEVVQGSDLAVSELFPPFVTLQWYNHTLNEQIVNHYELQQYNTTRSLWLVGLNIPENGDWVHSITTPVLSDGRTYNYRILAIGRNNEVSCARLFQVRMVCCPTLAEDTLKVEYDNASQEVVITGV